MSFADCSIDIANCYLCFFKVDQGGIICLHRIKARDVNGSLSLMGSKGWSWTFWKGQVKSFKP